MLGPDFLFSLCEDSLNPNHHCYPSQKYYRQPYRQQAANLHPRDYYRVLEQLQERVRRLEAVRGHMILSLTTLILLNNRPLLRTRQIFDF